MYARKEPPHPERRMASACGRLATPPAVDIHSGQPTTKCVNQFQRFFLSELILHHTNAPVLYVDPNGEWILPASIIAVTIAYIIWHDIHNIQHPPPIYAPEPPERPEPPALMAPNPNCRSFPIPRRSPNDPLNYSDPNDPNLRYNRPPRPMPPSRWRAATEFESHDPDLNVIEATNA